MIEMVIIFINAPINKNDCGEKCVCYTTIVGFVVHIDIHYLEGFFGWLVFESRGSFRNG